jgi:hypothetical protein
LREMLNFFMPNDVLSFSAHLTAASSSRCKWLVVKQQQCLHPAAEQAA